MGDRVVRINDKIAYGEWAVPSDASSVTARLRLVGQCDDAATVAATSFQSGVAQFHWDQATRDLPNGWYTLILMVDGCECGEYPLQINQSCSSSFNTSVAVAQRCGPNICPPLKANRKCDTTIITTSTDCETEICPTTDNRPMVYVPTYE